MNLGIGAYRCNEGNPVVLPSVKKAEEHVVKKYKENEYSPMEGISSFVQNSLKLAYGEELYSQI